MTVSRCPRAGTIRHPRTGTHVAAAALAVTAMFTALWAAPAAFASNGRHHPRPSASPPHPGWVRYYIVQPPANGHTETFSEIAAKTLHNSKLAMTIFNLNKDRLEPGGGRLESPAVLGPGWILVLPANASGPGVRYGPLPVAPRLPPRPPRRPPPRPRHRGRIAPLRPPGPGHPGPGCWGAARNPRRWAARS